jgi:hypothetical protein
LPAAVEPRGCALPLTLDNPTQHTAKLRVTPSTECSPFNITCFIAIQPTNAQQLQEHLDTVLLRARDGPRSPNAKRIVQQRLTASLENESTGIRRLEPLLLFCWR